MIGLNSCVLLFVRFSLFEWLWLNFIHNLSYQVQWNTMT